MDVALRAWFAEHASELPAAPQAGDRLRRVIQLNPPRRLMVAILERAIEDLWQETRPVPRTRRDREQRRSMPALAWFLRNERKWVYSFVNLCDSLEIDPSAVRTALGISAFLAARQHALGQSERGDPYQEGGERTP